MTPSLWVGFKETPYPIYIGSGLLQNGALLRQHIIAEQVLIVSNPAVSNHYLSRVQQALQIPCDFLPLPDGESHKNITQFQRIIDALANHHHHRDTTLIALGGGVIGDITGFAAACYQRGVGFIQIPTTLLAQVDASIGGKTAINHAMGKNLIGAFHQPQAVIIDIDTLSTLPVREFRAGIAEIIKAALIRDPAFFTWLEKNLSLLLNKEPATLMHAIQRACEIKRDIVIVDEKDLRRERALLNLGHTFAHAIEHTLGYGEWLHGEAVGLGLVLAAKLSHRRQHLSLAEVRRIEHLLTSASLPTALPAAVSVDTLMQAMHSDKKILAKQLRFILLKSIGHAYLADDVNTDDLLAILAQR